MCTARSRSRTRAVASGVTQWCGSPGTGSGVGLWPAGAGVHLAETATCPAERASR